MHYTHHVTKSKWTHVELFLFPENSPDLHSLIAAAALEPIRDSDDP